MGSFFDLDCSGRTDFNTSRISNTKNTMKNLPTQSPPSLLRIFFYDLRGQGWSQPNFCSNQYKRSLFQWPFFRIITESIWKGFCSNMNRLLKKPFVVTLLCPESSSGSTISESPNIMILFPVCRGQGCWNQFSMTFCIIYEFLKSTWIFYHLNWPGCSWQTTEIGKEY